MIYAISSWLLETCSWRDRVNDIDTNPLNQIAHTQRYSAEHFYSPDMPFYKYAAHLSLMILNFQCRCIRLDIDQT